MKILNSHQRWINFTLINRCILHLKFMQAFKSGALISSGESIVI
jgi:hypothetical protein